MTTKETLKALYDAFAEGNIPFILQSVSEDFTWEDPSDSSVVPYGGMHKGRSGFAEFFQQLGDSFETTLWEVKDYVSEGNKVVAAGRHGFKNRNTGKSDTTDWVMIWTFNGNTPVSGKAYYDTSAVETAIMQ